MKCYLPGMLGAQTNNKETLLERHSWETLLDVVRLSLDRDSREMLQDRMLGERY